MDKDSILSLAPYVLKRMEYGIDVFYLLNFDNDEIWTGNYTSYLIVSKLNGINSIGDIIDSLMEEYDDFNYEELLFASLNVLNELKESNFIIEVQNK